MKKFLSILTNGLLKENPLLVLMIGLCSSLGITTSLANGFGMGCAMTFVLVMSEIIISLFRKLIPDSIRIPVFIIVIATFTTIVDLLIKAYLVDLSKSLGVFIPLIVVNCIIMGRVESFASKQKPLNAALDAIGMGLGYLWVLCTISFIRELLGAGKILGHTVISEQYTIKFFSNAPGGFFVFGMLIACSVAINACIKKNKEQKAKLAITQAPIANTNEGETK